MSARTLPHTILVHFSGPDQPGLTAELTAVIGASLAPERAESELNLPFIRFAF